MSVFNEDALIWFNGELRPWPEAQIHVMSHVVHYGSCVFEGIRCYNTANGPAIFRLPEHIRRLEDSAKIYRMELPYSNEELIRACLEVVVRNNLNEAYIRPVVYRGYGVIGVNPMKAPVEVAVGAWPWGTYLGPDALKNGVDVRVASWQRPRGNTVATMAKAGGNYLGGQLVKMEAKIDGYAEGIMLDANGMISEGSGENVFIVRDGVVYTSPLTASILPGITRNCALRLLEELGIEVREALVPREGLYIADELFFTGTAAEITPVCTVDRIPVGEGKPGPITKQVQKRFYQIISGETEDAYGWLTPVKG